MAQSLNYLGLLYVELQKYEKAQKECEEALEIWRKLAENAPNTYQTYLPLNLNILGLLHFELQNYDEMEQVFSECLRIMENQLNYDYKSTNLSHYWLGVALCRQEKYEQAIPHFNIYSSFYPNDIRTYYYLSHAYSSIHDFPNALKHGILLKDAEQQEDPHNLGNLSYYAVGAGQFKDAEDYARQALALDATQTWIKTNLVTACLFQGKHEEAKGIALEIKDLDYGDGTTFRDSILEDLKLFEEIGIVPERYKDDVARLKKLLK